MSYFYAWFVSTLVAVNGQDSTGAVAPELSSESSTLTGYARDVPPANAYSDRFYGGYAYSKPFFNWSTYNPDQPCYDEFFGTDKSEWSSCCLDGGNASSANCYVYDQGDVCYDSMVIGYDGMASGQDGLYSNMAWTLCCRVVCDQDDGYCYRSIYCRSTKGDDYFDYDHHYWDDHETWFWIVIASICGICFIGVLITIAICCWCGKCSKRNKTEEPDLSRVPGNYSACVPSVAVPETGPPSMSAFQHNSPGKPIYVNHPVPLGKKDESSDDNKSSVVGSNSDIVYVPR